jgi:hypothetical protein
MTISCAHCGKFISYDDIENEKAKIAGGGISFTGNEEDIYFICKKCIEKANNYCDYGKTIDS